MSHERRPVHAVGLQIVKASKNVLYAGTHIRGPPVIHLQSADACRLKRLREPFVNTTRRTAEPSARAEDVDDSTVTAFRFVQSAADRSCVSRDDDIFRAPGGHRPLRCNRLAGAHCTTAGRREGAHPPSRRMSIAVRSASPPLPKR